MNLQNPFEDSRAQFRSFYWLKFFDFAQNSSEERQAATCCFSKEFCENLGNLLTNSKKEIKIQNRIVHALPEFKRVLLIQKHLLLSD